MIEQENKYQISEEQYKDRRSLLFLNMILIAHFLLQIQTIDKLNLLGNEMPLGNPQYIYPLIVAVWLYFNFRHIQNVVRYDIEEMQKVYNEKMKKHVRTRANQLVRKEKGVKFYFSNAYKKDENYILQVFEKDDFGVKGHIDEGYVMKGKTLFYPSLKSISYVIFLHHRFFDLFLPILLSILAGIFVLIHLL